MRRIAFATVGIALLGCGGGGDGGTEPNPVPTSVSIAASGTGNMTAAGQTRTLTATVRDQNNQVMTGMQVDWESSNTAFVTVSPARGVTTTATAVANGTATITATAGSADDTEALTVAIGGGGFPGSAAVTATTTNQFSPATVNIADEGEVTWTFESVTHNVVFASTTGAPGNIAAMANGTASRTFSTPGTFEYECTIHSGMDGTVIVH